MMLSGFPVCYSRSEAFNFIQSHIARYCNIVDYNSPAYLERYDGQSFGTKHPTLYYELFHADDVHTLENVAKQIGYAFKVDIKFQLNHQEFNPTKAEAATREAAARQAAAKQKKRQLEEELDQHEEDEDDEEHKEFPFTIKYTSSYRIPAQAKYHCGLLIPGPVVAGGRQLQHERVIDKDNIKLFAEWCKAQKESAMFKKKVGLDLAKVYSFFHPKRTSKRVTSKKART